MRSPGYTSPGAILAHGVSGCLYAHGLNDWARRASLKNMVNMYLLGEQTSGYNCPGVHGTGAEKCIFCMVQRSQGAELMNLKLRICTHGYMGCAWPGWEVKRKPFTLLYLPQSYSS